MSDCKVYQNKAYNSQGLIDFCGEENVEFGLNDEGFVRIYVKNIPIYHNDIIIKYQGKLYLKVEKNYGGVANG
ncbi:MAG: hypothetical protein ACOCRK_11615 [bacterium]